MQSNYLEAKSQSNLENAISSPSPVMGRSSPVLPAPPSQVDSSTYTVTNKLSPNPTATSAATSRTASFSTFFSMSHSPVMVRRGPVSQATANQAHMSQMPMNQSPEIAKKSPPSPSPVKQSVSLSSDNQSNLTNSPVAISASETQDKQKDCDPSSLSNQNNPESNQSTCGRVTTDPLLSNPLSHEVTSSEPIPTKVMPIEPTVTDPVSGDTPPGDTETERITAPPCLANNYMVDVSTDDC